MTARSSTLWRLGVVFLLAYGAAVAVAWSELPARIPMHFGLDGRVDRWTEHAVWVWFSLPLIAAGMAVFLRVLGRFAARHPEIWNVPRKDEFLSLSERARRPIVESLDAFLAATSLGAGLLFAAIQAGVYLAATGRSGGRNPSEGPPRRSAGRSRFDVALFEVIDRGPRVLITHMRASMSDMPTRLRRTPSLSPVSPRLVMTALFLLGVPAGLAAQDTGSHYAGMQGREIKALSENEIDGLLTGEGMGYALPAELNGYPGPRHVLDLAGELALTDRQRNEVQDVFDRMRAAAVDLGERLVAAERALDRAFASGGARPDRVDRLTREAAVMEGRLRAVHLKAHLETKDLLTDEQAETYDRLRGYQSEHRHGGHEP